jgi:predicted phage tail protein
MVKIKLLGELGRRFGREFQLAVRTPAEALRALCMQIPGMRQYFLDSGEKGIDWRIVTEHPYGLDEQQLMWPMSKRMVVAPQPVGRGGVGKIIAGVALVATAIILGPIGAPLLYGSAAAGGFLGVTGATILGSLGASLLFSGVADLLTPTPKIQGARGGAATSGRSREEQQNAYTFDKSNANTAQGEVVPVLYGERIIGALPILSFGIELQNQL